MKTLTQHISQVKTLHSLNEFIEEKLVINKNFKTKDNDEFYNEFQEELEYDSHFIWKIVSELKNVIPIAIYEKEKKVITDTFDIKKKILYTRINNMSNNYAIHIYKKMIDFINNNDDIMEFIYGNYDDYKMYGVYLFKTEKKLLCIIGPKEIDIHADPWMYTSSAHLIMQDI